MLLKFNTKIIDENESFIDVQTYNDEAFQFLINNQYYQSTFRFFDPLNNLDIPKNSIFLMLDEINLNINNIIISFFKIFYSNGAKVFWADKNYFEPL